MSAILLNQSEDKTSLVKAGISKWSATIIACICSFMVVVDGSIVNVSLNTIREALLLSEIQMQWVVDIYLLCLGGFMLLAARASDIYGRKNILLFGITIFTLSSLIGGFATVGEMLIIARAFQGLGAAILATSPLAIIVAAHDNENYKERSIGYWAACAATGSAVGVFLGGMLTTYLGWEWIMFINVPVGIALLILVHKSFNNIKQECSIKLDWLGAVSSTIVLSSLLYAVTYSTHNGWDLVVVLLLIISLVCFVIFLVTEKKAQAPLIRLSIFKYKSLSVGLVIVMMLGVSLTSALYFLSLSLQSISGLSPATTGIQLLPMALSLAITALLSRYLRDKGIKQLPLIGNLLVSTGFAVLVFLPMSSTYIFGLFFAIILIGAGNGFVMMSATNMVLSGIPKVDSGLAAGLQNTARQLGGAIGIALLSGVAFWVKDSMMKFNYIFLILSICTLITGILAYFLTRYNQENA